MHGKAAIEYRRKEVIGHPSCLRRPKARCMDDALSGSEAQLAVPQ
jgi:hypothetical protein